ncbi:cell division protein FtsA, partial [Candidatus Cerribacteria bacterium 'Amazon FNV 2010 28 9']
MSRQQVISAIDIGTEKICTIIAARDGETGALQVVGIASVPSTGMKKSQVVDLEDVIAAITKSVDSAERMAGFSISNAYVSISGSHIASQNSKGVVAVANPDAEITSDDVRRVIEAARAISLPSAREVIHVIPREFKVDSQDGIKDPIGMSGVRLEAEAHIVTGSATALRNVAKCVSEVGVNISSFVFAGLASSHAVLSETEKELGVVVLDIGAGTTAMAAFVEGALTYSCVLPIGARHITQDIALGS